MGGSHNIIVVEKGGEFWEAGVDSGRVTSYYSSLKEGYILGERGRFWEGRI